MTLSSMESEAPKSALETEFSDIDAKEAWPLIFQHIRSECLNHDFTTCEAKKRHNMSLNRYRDVIPYDHSRIVLNSGPTEYINANLVKMEKARRQYILTQGPLPSTTGHFWLMIWEQKCKAIVMLNKIIEKKQIKCHMYWPSGKQPGVDDTLDLPDVGLKGLKVQHLSETEASYYITRVFRLTDVASGESREVLQFHYMTWPDFGVPQSPTVFLRFLSVVRKSGALDSDVGPAVVHCSAGIGRSGTFCLVDSCLVLMEEYGADAVNVRDVLLEMRRYRMGLAQTPDQLRFSYLAIIKGHRDGLEDDDLDNSDKDIELEALDNQSDEPPPLPPPRGESLRSNASSIDSQPSSPEADSVSEADSDESESSTEAPTRPLPTEPFSESMQSDSVSSEPPSRPLPELPGNMSSSEGSLEVNSSPDSPVLSESDDGLRERRKSERSDRNDRMREKLQGMKRKQKQADEWQQLKRSSKVARLQDTSDNTPSG